MDIANEFLPSTGLLFGGMTMCEPSHLMKAGIDLTLFAVGSHVSRLLAEDKPVVSPMSAGYGLNSHGSLAFFDLRSRSWKTYQGCLMGGLIPFLETWPQWGSMRNGALFRRACSVPHTHGKGCSYWPTPTASMGKRGFGFSRTGRPRANRDTLARVHAIGWSPSPELWDWVMGFPPGWTDLESSATPSSPK